MSKFNTNEVEEVYTPYLERYNIILCDMEDYYNIKKDSPSFQKDFIGKFSSVISDFATRVSSKSIVSALIRGEADNEDLETFRSEVQSLLESLNSKYISYCQIVPPSE